MGLFQIKEQLLIKKIIIKNNKIQNPAVRERVPGVSNREGLWLSVMPSSRAEMTDAALKAWQLAVCVEETRQKSKRKEKKRKLKKINQTTQHYQ